MLWIHFTCLQDPKLPVPASLYEKIKDFESQITASFVDPTNPANPFKGMVQALMLAGNMHAKFTNRAEAVVYEALASGTTMKAWQILRDAVQEFAGDIDIGFPQANALLERRLPAA
jgi:hypothetical protein